MKDKKQGDIKPHECCESARKIKALVAQQAEDEGLWSVPVFGLQSIGEAYLQRELRKLHSLIEEEFGAT